MKTVRYPRIRANLLPKCGRPAVSGAATVSRSPVHAPPSAFRKPQHPKRYLVGGNASHRLSTDRANAWLTPPFVVEEVRRAFGGAIDLDPCTEPDNPTGALRFYTAADDGLGRSWKGRVYCNPPYSPLAPWIAKAIESSREGATIYLLLPLRMDAVYHHRLLRECTDLLIFLGRICFIRADGGPSGHPAFGSMLVGLNVSTRPFEKLGTVVEFLP